MVLPYSDVCYLLYYTPRTSPYLGVLLESLVHCAP
jgi:hypothetical protein